ncbi:hypothetical protein FRB93_006271 [Tulasnella sp. JGI-2019a]|nr:hypothetical protein FRB93_006271 [Tulasnella sp. JGI-2019a]
MSKQQREVDEGFLSTTSSFNLGCAPAVRFLAPCIPLISQHNDGLVFGRYVMPAVVKMLPALNDTQCITATSGANLDDHRISGL